MREMLDAFAEMVAAGDGKLHGELDRAALTLAAAIDPGVDVDGELAKLDQLATMVAGGDVHAVAAALFSDQVSGVALNGGLFRGNSADYYDADNSLLHRVVERRLGIPITLAVLLIEVGRRKGVSMHGVGMPGHFLVGSAAGYIDAFHGGRILDRDGCEQLFAQLAGVGASLPANALAPTPPAAIVGRMLNNLGAIAADKADRRMLYAVRAMQTAFPESDFRTHVQFAYAAADYGRFDTAAAAGERALPLVPETVQPRLERQIAYWRANLN